MLYLLYLEYVHSCTLFPLEFYNEILSWHVNPCLWGIIYWDSFWDSVKVVVGIEKKELRNWIALQIYKLVEYIGVGVYVEL